VAPNIWCLIAAQLKGDSVLNTSLQQQPQTIFLVSSLTPTSVSFGSLILHLTSIMEKGVHVKDGEVTADPKRATALDATSLNGSFVVDDGEYLTGWKLKIVTLTLALGMFLVGVDSSIIGVVTPRITTAFHSMDDIAWYGSGYMLPHTVLQPTLGTFYKSFHVTYVYFFSVVIFERKLISSCLWALLYETDSNCSRIVFMCRCPYLDCLYRRPCNIWMRRCWGPPGDFEHCQ
jgi:hypothetical protein